MISEEADQLFMSDDLIDRVGIDAAVENVYDATVSVALGFNDGTVLIGPLLHYMRTTKRGEPKRIELEFSVALDAALEFLAATENADLIMKVMCIDKGDVKVIDVKADHALSGVCVTDLQPGAARVRLGIEMIPVCDT